MLQNPPTVTDVGVPEATQGLAVGPAGSGGLGPVAVAGRGRWQWLAGAGGSGWPGPVAVAGRGRLAVAG